jgi:hypothetical protein
MGDVARGDAGEGLIQKKVVIPAQAGMTIYF